MNAASVLNFRPPRIAMSFVLVAVAAHAAVPLSLHPGLPVTAAVTGLAGFAMMLRAWWLFKADGTAICPTHTPSSLVTRDIFTLSRNPMYLGMIMMLAALALLFGTLPFYVVLVIFAAILDRIFCPYEERQLQQQFGERFASYRSRVGRWIRTP